MLTVLIFFIFHNLHCTVSTSPPSPINVTFSSLNLRNVLHWFPGNGTYTEETHFTVEYAIYGDRIQGSRGKRVNWRAVQHCTEIVWTWCDLSSETWDLDQGYHARVRAVNRGASSKWALILRRFDPKMDTKFGPPLVSVEIEDNSAIITVKGPMRYPPNNHTPALSMATVYPQMTYNLSIHNTHRNQTYHFPMVNSVYKYRLLEYNTEYCFSAQSRFPSMPIHCQSSAWLCITTPQDPVIEQLQRVIVGIIVPALCICVIIAAGYFLHRYLSGKDQSSPSTLGSPTFYKCPIMFPPENTNFFLISPINPEPSESTNPISVSAWPSYTLQVPDPPPSYSSQRPETPSEPDEPLDDLSADYGGISMAPQITVGGEEEAREGTHDDGEWRIETGHSAGGYCPQANSSRTCRQTPMQIQMHTHAEMSMHVRAHPWSPVSSASQNQNQALLQSFQGSAMGGVNKKKKDRELPSVLVSKTPQTGFFQINLQAKEEVGRGEELGGEMRLSTDRERVIDRSVEEGNDCENVPLISAYASQNIQNMASSHSDQSDTLQDDYGIIRPAAGQETEEDYYEEEEEEGGTLCINWDSKSRKLVLPKMEMGFNHVGRLDEPLLSERGISQDEEEYVARGRLMLENVFVRQASEEEAQKALENDEETGSEVEDILNKWDLKIPMDQ